MFKKKHILSVSVILLLIFFACSGDYTNEPVTDIPTVKNLSVSNSGPNNLKILWDFDSDLTCNFRIDKMGDNQTWIENYAAVESDKRYWEDQITELGELYSYRFYSIYKNELSDELEISFVNNINPPTGLTTLPLGEASIQLNWTDNAFDEAGTIIERKDGIGGIWKEVYTTPGNVTSWTDIRLIPEVTYSYRVKAYFTTHYSEYSNESQNSTVAEGFIYVPPGTFLMGSNYDDEQPVHSVTITRGYLIGKYEITQKEWNDLMTAYTSHLTYPYGSDFYGTGDNYPVYKASWYSALVYCNERSLFEGLTPCYSIKGSVNPADWGLIPNGEHDPDWESAELDMSSNGYRLPTEAEWEYAARYDDNRIYPWGNDPPSSEKANFNGNVGLTSIVGSYPSGSSKLGISDMAGNVWEFCWDKADIYDSDSVIDPTGSSQPSPFTKYFRIARGGSWYHSHDATTVRTTFRNSVFSSVLFGGLRVVKQP